MTPFLLPTQAQVTRAVKAAIKGAHEMGYRIASFKVTFAQGIPSVEIVIGESEKAVEPRVVGAVDIAKFKASLEARHAARRP